MARAKEDWCSLEASDIIANAKRAQRGNFSKVGWKNFISTLLEETRKGAKSAFGVIELVRIE